MGLISLFDVEIAQVAKIVSALYNNIVISAGPWSPRVFESLFPESLYKIPMEVNYKAGNISVPKHRYGSPRTTQEGRPNSI